LADITEKFDDALLAQAAKIYPADGDDSVRGVHRHSLEELDLCFVVKYCASAICKFCFSTVTKTPLETDRARVMLLRQCENKNDYDCGIQSLGRRIFKVGRRSYDGKRARRVYQNC
jgi:hypothetical protein